MKQEINLNNWDRKEHFKFFSEFDEPFFGITIQINCTKAIEYCKKNNYSFFLFYLHKALLAVNSIENFKYRIIEKKVFMFDKIDASATILRPNNTFGFSYIPFSKSETAFFKLAQDEITRVKKSNTLIPAVSGENVVHFSAIPWLFFSSLSHARNFKFQDSSPKISFGKVEKNSKLESIMPIAIHAHHSFVDGYHIHLFATKFQQYLNLEITN
ncbi:MAG: CatA-like O-acetyltransferase [Lutibacter sp.]